MATLIIDDFEYATDGAAQLAYVSDAPANLQVYSEATIKTQGSYSLKVVADTSSINKTLTHTFSPVIDLTGVNNLKIDMRSNRTGSNVKLTLGKSGVSGTGGDISHSGGYTYHTFKTSGTFTPTGVTSVEVLVVAGGGAGANYDGGGGGAGGLLYDATHAVTISTPYTVTIGAGGVYNGSNWPQNGGDSIFDGMDAVGGGVGAQGGGGSEYLSSVGGSGGGGSATPGSGTGSAGTLGQGNKGGDCASGDYYNPAGGGGGAGGVGGDSTNLGGDGHGGIGLEYSQFASVGGYPAGWFAGGGGGGSYFGGAGTGGNGGGGNGSGDVGDAGVVNTGGGGGGAGADGLPTGIGGSGVVIIRYADVAPIIVSEITPNIVVANQFQTINWDISAIADGDKNSIDQFIITILDASASNTFYLDYTGEYWIITSTVWNKINNQTMITLSCFKNRDTRLVGLDNFLFKSMIFLNGNLLIGDIYELLKVEDKSVINILVGAVDC